LFFLSSFLFFIQLSPICSCTSRPPARPAASGPRIQIGIWGGMGEYIWGIHSHSFTYEEIHIRFTYEEYKRILRILIIIILTIMK
jgi:hypothetical protein